MVKEKPCIEMRGFLYLYDTPKFTEMSTNVNEIWKDIQGYEGIYKISNTGKIISLSRSVWGGGRFYTITEKKKSPSTCHYGYYVIMLYKDNKPKLFKLHRLIALHFIPNPNDYKIINHKDGNKKNNSLDNLEWCNHAMNNKHAHDTGLKKATWLGKKKFDHCNTMKIQCTATGNIYTMQEAADFIGVTRSSMCLMLKNKLKNWSTFIYG